MNLNLCHRVCAAFVLATLLGSTFAQASWRYTVRAGDTLEQIADSYLKPEAGWQKLQALNAIPDPLHLRPGSQLRIPLALLRQEAALAQVVYVHGEAEVQTAATGPFQRLSVGHALRAGDVLRTALASSATLRFVDGSRVLLTENSRIQLSALLSFGKSGMADTRLRLDEGAVETRVSPQRGSAARFEVKAPAMNLGVRGTDFRVRVDASGTTRSEVLEGRVAADARHRQIMLGAGFGSLAQLGEAPRPPQALPAAPDLSRVPARQERLPLRFQWPAQTGAKAYRAQVFAQGEEAKLLLEGIFELSAAKWPELPDGEYRLRVRAIDREGMEGLGSERAFTLKARPEAPFLIQPQQAGKSYGEFAHFRWSQAAGASAYRIQLAADEDFSRPLVEQVVGEAEWQWPLEPGNYFWRVATLRSDQDQGPFSDSLAFTQRPIPVSPGVDQPEIDADRLSFAWRSGEVGERYQFQFARDAEFQELLVDQVVSEPQLAFPRPAGGLYYMRARTLDADGFAGPFGAVQKIDVPATRHWLYLLPLLLLIHL